MALPKANDFDLIRLFAATQVAVHHASVHLAIDHSGSILFQLSGLFPGVPVFFFVSGFLISLSYERNPRVFDYIQNRLLRIYPALYVCFAISILSVHLSGYFQSVDNSVSYGVYIYHMPVVNGLLAAGYSGSYAVLTTALAITAALASASWRFVEKPTLGLKRHALYKNVSPRSAKNKQPSGAGAGDP